MSSVAVLKVDRADAAREYLGPAVVTDASPQAVQARLPDGSCVRAEMALAFPYEPRTEDVVLVIGRGDAHYVIGVIRGAGETRLSFQGNVDLRAVGGTLTLSGDSGVKVRGKELEILAGAVKVVADSMVQKLSSAYQRVTGLLSVRAGESHTIVDGASTSRSKSGVILTEEKMTINGKQIFLG
jgi:hypothetical protein